MKDHQLSTPSCKSQLQQPRERLNEIISDRVTSVFQTQGNEGPKSADAELKVYKYKKETDQSGSMEGGDDMMGNVDLNPSVKPKHSKKRRQRRKCAGQRIVGLPCSPSAAAPVLLWFRRDLRLCDNPAVIGSLEVGVPVIPVFIWSPEEEEGPGITVAMGGACKLTQRQ